MLAVFKTLILAAATARISLRFIVQLQNNTGLLQALILVQLR
jgi:hypothetical protein